jgi:hypothetical protein
VVAYRLCQSHLPAVTLTSESNSVTGFGVLCLPGVARVYCVPRRRPYSRLRFFLIGDFSMFKMPAYDPFSVVLMGLGILLAATSSFFLTHLVVMSHVAWDDHSS